MVIVVGYVPKPEGRAALARAAEEAKLRGGRLIVINASRGDALVDAGYAGVQEIELVKSRLAASGVPHELRQLVRGHEPAEEVVELAEEVGAELIVIGMRHRTAVGKFLLGSTAQRILMNAHCPVLAVKADGRGSAHESAIPSESRIDEDGVR
jgi:nucleotide-binding universal stress UspA family protein